MWDTSSYPLKRAGNVEYICALKPDTQALLTFSHSCDLQACSEMDKFIVYENTVENVVPVWRCKLE